MQLASLLAKAFKFQALLERKEAGSLEPASSITSRPKIEALHLRRAAVYKQFGARHEAAVVGSQEHQGLTDFIGRT
jgi:hypothetical protein